jgi:hypothetical protein
MSPKAITMRLKKLSQLRELCLELKLSGKKAGLDNNGGTQKELSTENLLKG